MKDYSCTECGEEFATWAGLEQHMRGAHVPESEQAMQGGAVDFHVIYGEDIRPLSCNICGGEFEDVAELKWHEAEAHGARDVAA
jgi:hypothetical protein